MAGRIYILSWLSGRVVKSLKLIIVVLIIFAMLYAIKLYSQQNKADAIKKKTTKFTNDDVTHSLIGLSPDALVENRFHKNLPQLPIKTTSTNKKSTTLHKKDFVYSNKPVENSEPCYNVHVFYYPWYGNPKFDKQYIHWNHQFIPHWDPNIAKRYPTGAHIPPDDLGSDFYPELGPYSSRDPNIITKHMEQLVSANIGVIIVSYYPPNQADDNGQDWHRLYPSLFSIAIEYKVKVGFHIEPYKNRNEKTLKRDLIYIIDTFSKYPSFYTFNRNGKALPMVYVYDSYHTKPDEWRRILNVGGADTIRGTLYDAYVIGLYVEQGSERAIASGGFDGFYTYFAANGFTYGSTRHNWVKLNEIGKKKNLMFIPSVGPGYIDTRVRPWNSQNTRNRLKGTYYRDSWNEAMKLSPEIISITSFNEWHEGTQIEKAIPHTYKSYVYKNYNPHSSDYYLSLTKSFSKKFLQCKK